MDNSISSDGRNNTKIASRIAQARLFPENEKSLLNTFPFMQEEEPWYIEPFLCMNARPGHYQKLRKKLEATEMWFIRRML